MGFAWRRNCTVTDSALQKVSAMMWWRASRELLPSFLLLINGMPCLSLTKSTRPSLISCLFVAGLTGRAIILMHSSQPRFSSCRQWEVFIYLWRSVGHDTTFSLPCRLLTMNSDSFCCRWSQIRWGWPRQSRCTCLHQLRVYRFVFTPIRLINLFLSSTSDVFAYRKQWFIT